MKDSISLITIKSYRQIELQIRFAISELGCRIKTAIEIGKIILRNFNVGEHICDDLESSMESPTGRYTNIRRGSYKLFNYDSDSIISYKIINGAVINLSIHFTPPHDDLDLGEIINLIKNYATQIKLQISETVFNTNTQ